MANLSTLVPNKLTFATAKAFNWNGLTTNTFLDFENIPTWARKITIIFDNVSTNGSSQRLVQLGTSSGYVSTGYLSYWGYYTSGPSVVTTSSTAGFGVWSANNPDLIIGHMLITRLSPTSNRWISSHVIGFTQGSQAFTACGGGNVSITSTVDRVRITSLNGTDQFDGGTVNISYEG